MKLLLCLFILSCTHAPPGPPRNAYHVLIFSLKAGETRPYIIENCTPYSLRSGRLKIESAIADFTNQGMYCQENGSNIDYECTSTFKMIKAVLVQGRRECLSIPQETIIKERRAL